MFLTAVAFGLLVAGVVGSIAPRVPGAAFSLLGVYLYWWSVDFAEPALVTVGLLTLVGVLALAGRLFGTVVAARIGGASTVTATIAGIVGFIGFLSLGTTGLLLGTVLTVFVLEYLRRRNVKTSAVAAIAVVLGTFASRTIQVLLTGAMLVVMVLAVFF